MENKKLKNNLLDKVLPIVIIVAIALLIVNNFMLFERGGKVTEAKVVLEEQLRPAELQLVKINSDNCQNCFDIENAIEELKNQNVKITIEEEISSDSQQGKELISKYNIKKLPTIIVSGEIEKSEQLVNYFKQKGEIQDDKFIYTDIAPPYFDTALNKINGIVTMTYVVDSFCEKCVDLTPISSSLQEQGVYIQNEKSVEYNSNEGKSLIKQFEIKQVPAILISEEIDYYSDVKDALIQSGAIKKNGFYAVHSTIPPYRDLAQNKIVGLVDVVYLTKDDCSVCYDVSVNKDILLQFGLVLNKENTYDINSQEGKSFIQKYSITKAPVILVSPDAKYYSSFEQAWESVGTIENDGWFVMRNPELIGTYWDLEDNIVVEVE